MSKQREEFENIERVKSILNKYDWFFDLMNNQYVLESHQGDIKCAMASNYLDGMWFMWQQAQKVAVPDGYKLMPIEPSAELVNHGHQVFLGHFNEGGQTGGRSLYFAYKAMIEAQEQAND